MKKYLAMAMAAACALSFTACHDDDDDDDKDYVADFTTINQVSYIPGAQTAANKLGLNAFMLSDVNGYTDVTCYMSADTTEITPNMQISEEMFQNFYGGICPTAFTADDEKYTFFRPACGKYHSGSGALVCNSGTLCRALHAQALFCEPFSCLGLIEHWRHEGIVGVPDGRLQPSHHRRGAHSAGCIQLAQERRNPLCGLRLHQNHRLEQLERIRKHA